MDVNEIVAFFCSELLLLQEKREFLCGTFLTGKIEITELCLALDQIGKRFERIYVLSQSQKQDKSNSFAELAAKCENEMLLTRMILKSIIKFLSRSQNLKLY